LLEDVLYFLFSLASGTPIHGLHDLYIPDVASTQILFLLSSATFLGLLLWSIVLFVRARKIDPTSKIYPPDF